MEGRFYRNTYTFFFIFFSRMQNFFLFPGMITSMLEKLFPWNVGILLQVRPNDVATFHKWQILKNLRLKWPNIFCLGYDKQVNFVAGNNYLHGCPQTLAWWLEPWTATLSALSLLFTLTGTKTIFPVIQCSRFGYVKWLPGSRS